MNAIFRTVRFLCKDHDIFSDIECHNLIQPLSTRYYDMVNNFDSISHLISTRSKRSSWFSGVGTVFKHLFGTMDEDDAVRYNNAIQTVVTDQKELAKYMKQNILITSSTLSAFQEALNKIDINEQSLNSAIESITSSLNNLTTVLNNLVFKSKFMMLLNMLENSLLTLSFKIEDIINGLMFSKNNVLYPSIMSPKQLYQDLVENYRLLSSFKLLPVSLDLDHIHILINISEMLSYYSNNKIVFILKIPLVTIQEFNLYHNLPLPMAHNMTNAISYVTIIPTNKYIGITRDKSNYCNLNSLINCKIIDSQYYLCPLINIYSSSANPTCESEMLSKVINTMPTQCKTKFLLGSMEIWQQLQNGNWIFIISDRTKISIDCPKINVYTIDIMGTGILTVPSECIGHYKETQLTSKSNFKINLKTIVTNFDLINDSCCNSVKFEESKSNIPVTKLKNINLDSLKYNENLFHEIENSVNKIIDKPHILEYGIYYSYTTTCIVLSILLYISYKIWKISKCRKYFIKPIPTSTNVDPEIIPDAEEVESPIPLPRLNTSMT